MDTSREELGKIVEEITITYSVKELLAGIKDQLIRIDEQHKAAVTLLQREIESLKLWRAKVIGVSMAVGAMSGGGVSMLVTAIIDTGAS